MIADISLGDIIWGLIVFFFMVVYLIILFSVVVDLFRDDELSGWAKAGWALFILFIPLIGVLAYVIARPSTADTGRYVANEYATR